MCSVLMPRRRLGCAVCLNQHKMCAIVDLLHAKVRTFKDGSVLGAGNSAAPKEISVDTVDSGNGILDEIFLASYSKSGTCYYMRHLNATGANAGTFLGSVKTAAANCTAKFAETPANVPNLAAL